MRFQIGDLVTISDTRSGSHTYGIVAKVSKANSSSLESSKHSVSLLKNSPDIYYVIFPEDYSVKGPYYTSELTAWI